MIRLSILYPDQPGKRFDMDYYLKTHMPLSVKRHAPALRDVAIERGYDSGIEGVGKSFIAMTHMLFDSQQAFLDAFLPHAEELQGDMANYTDIEPIIQLSEVESIELKAV